MSLIDPKYIELSHQDNEYLSYLLTNFQERRAKLQDINQTEHRQMLQDQDKVLNHLSGLYQMRKQYLMHIKNRQINNPEKQDDIIPKFQHVEQLNQIENNNIQHEESYNQNQIQNLNEQTGPYIQEKQYQKYNDPQNFLNLDYNNQTQYSSFENQKSDKNQFTIKVDPVKQIKQKKYKDQSSSYSPVADTSEENDTSYNPEDPEEFISSRKSSKQSKYENKRKKNKKQTQLDENMFPTERRQVIDLILLEYSKLTKKAQYSTIKKQYQYYINFSECFKNLCLKQVQSNNITLKELSGLLKIDEDRIDKWKKNKNKYKKHFDINKRSQINVQYQQEVKSLYMKLINHLILCNDYSTVWLNDQIYKNDFNEIKLAIEQDHKWIKQFEYYFQIDEKFITSLQKSNKKQQQDIDKYFNLVNNKSKQLIKLCGCILQVFNIKHVNNQQNIFKKVLKN